LEIPHIVITVRDFQALVSSCLYTGHLETSKQLPATATALSLTVPFRRDTEWLCDRHCGRSVALPASVLDTDLCLDRWGNTLSYESVHKSYSGTHRQTETPSASLRRPSMEARKCPWRQSFTCRVKLGCLWLEH